MSTILEAFNTGNGEVAIVNGVEPVALAGIAQTPDAITTAVVGTFAWPIDANGDQIDGVVFINVEANASDPATGDAGVVSRFVFAKLVGGVASVINVTTSYKQTNVALAGITLTPTINANQDIDMVVTSGDAAVIDWQLVGICNVSQ